MKSIPGTAVSQTMSSSLNMADMEIDESWPNHAKESSHLDQASNAGQSIRMQPRQTLHDERDEYDTKPILRDSAYLKENTYRGGLRRRRAPITSADEYSDISLPHVLIGYLQFILNLLIVLGLIYMAFFFYQTIRHDVDLKIDEYSKDAIAEIALCSKYYIENKCNPQDRIPAMQHTCTNWEKCMSRDPYIVGRGKVSAETLGEILNGFVEPMSYKTMLFLFLFAVVFIVVSNLALKAARSRAVPHSDFHYR